MNDASEVLLTLYEHIAAAAEETEGGAAEELDKVGAGGTHSREPFIARIWRGALARTGVEL